MYRLYEAGFSRSVREGENGEWIVKVAYSIGEGVGTSLFDWLDRGIVGTL
jgi:hypothetical protein